MGGECIGLVPAIRPGGFALDMACILMRCRKISMTRGKESCFRKCGALPEWACFTIIARALSMESYELRF